MAGATVRRAEILTATGFLVFALAVVVQARAVGSGWSAGQPQSGFFPYWIGLALGVCGAVVLGQVLIGEGRSAHAFFDNRTGLLSVLKVSLTGIGMLVLTYVVGFYTAALVYVFAYTRFVGRHSWLASVVLSVVVSFGSFYLFERVLAILLPRGIYRIVPFF